MSGDGVERLHKRIASSGLCSRRTAEEWIAAGRVAVNGKIVVEMGFRVGPEDVVAVDGRNVEQPRLMYLMMNKPKGYVTTLRDPEGRRTVLDLLPQLSSTLKPIGRLDKETEGLLLFTNDGEIAQRVAHPRYELEKEYIVTVRGIPDGKSLERLERGVWIPEGGKTRPAQVDRVFPDEKRDRCTFRMTIHEGRKRQVRQMCLAIGFPVRELKRVRVGPVELQSLARGTSRMLTQPEIDALFHAVGLQRVQTNPKRERPGRNQ